MPDSWVSVVFMQGDEANEALDLLNDESVAAAVDYLSQWDYGTESEHSPYDSEPWGRYDDTALYGRYTLAWDARIGYISLNRLASVTVEDMENDES